MKIDCTDFRKYLDAYFDGELADPERGEFDAHIAVCGDCRKHYAQRAWFQGAIRPALRRSCSLSEGARARLQDSLVGARRQLRRRSMIRRLAPVVPAAVAVGAVFMLVTPLTGFVPVIDEAVEQHCEQAPVEVPTPETDELEGWFAGKLPFRFQAPRFRQQEGVMLLGGRLTRLAGPETTRRQAAYLVYGVGRHKLSVLVFDGGSLDVGDVGRQQVVNGRTLSMHDSRGYRVALFRQGELAYAVTSDLPEERMVDLISAAF
ncbi:MAG: zf-HC2 domain-containing protein [Myxococcales bacterium]|nr:zf-HC2 domain-containing protein [Myxococcales bacterium]MCB9548823.1 zf-HC2 domain-containing protein [Myxococcales bacterium]